MPLTLLPATLADVPVMTSIYLSAFQDVIAHDCFPRTSPHIKDWWTSSNMDDMKNQASARFLKVVDGDDIVAYAKWNVPVQQGSETVLGGDNPEDMPVWPQDANVELCDEFFGHLARERKRIMGNRSHYYLEIVATLPQHQGKGAAGKMIRWGLDQADRDGLEAYVEASPLAVPVYEHYGWTVVADFTLKDREHTESCMIRSPQQTSKA
ncbi:hypothetical protein MMC26_007454 [Xylographa opegraphella]|nr:hypothetical protein [Xylographa opegraphella]